MLPFFKKRLAPIVIAKQSEDGKISEEPQDDHADEGMKQAFTEMCKAIDAGDMDAGASALKSFFEIADSDEEGEEEAE